MATDDEVRELIGLTWPLTDPALCPWRRCDYCGALLLVAGAWHPDAQTGAYLVLACEACRSTANGGAP